VGGGSTAANGQTASSVAVTGKIAPTGKLTIGQPFSIGGIISSNHTIGQVSGGVYSADGKTKILYCEDKPGTTTYDLKARFDDLLTFNSLQAGKYIYKITVRTVTDDIVAVQSEFTVG
ncbi:MAG TPA: hypothetical protein DCZ71_06755, partial [Ruminococcus sp.]|nr:hypothetical protein [Ruminococcus sp.]